MTKITDIAIDALKGAALTGNSDRRWWCLLSRLLRGGEHVLHFLAEQLQIIMGKLGGCDGVTLFFFETFRLLCQNKMRFQAIPIIVRDELTVVIQYPIEKQQDAAIEHPNKLSNKKSTAGRRHNAEKLVNG